MHWRNRRAMALVGAILVIISSAPSGMAESRASHLTVRLVNNSVVDTLVAAAEAAPLAVPGRDQERAAAIGTGQVIGGEDLRHLAARGAEDVTSLQAGVVIDRQTGALYVRGGDANELVYYVDGVPLQDVFTGRSSARVGAASIENVTVATGGLDVGHSWRMAGAAVVSTVDGGSRLHGSAEAITDNFHGERYDYNLYGLSLNGPLIPNSDRLTFAVAGERGWVRGASLGTWTWNGKLRWKPSQNITARVGGQSFQEDFRTFLRSYYFDYQHAPRTVNKSGAFWGEMTHELSSKTSYSLRGYWVGQDSKTGDGVYFDNLWGYGRPYGNPRYDQTTLFWDWDDLQLDPDSLAKGVYFAPHTPTVDSVRDVVMPDGDTIQRRFVMSGDEGSVWDDYVHRKASYVGGKADLVSRIGSKHALNIGGEFQRHTLRSYHHYFPKDVYSGVYGGYKDADFYGFGPFGSATVDTGMNGAKHPVNISGYVQDRFEISDAAVSAGLRMDYFDYDAYRLRDPADPLDPDHNLERIRDDPTIPPRVADSLAMEAGMLTMADLAKAKALVRLSPRLGASFQVPGGSLLHFAYGKYFQRPDFGALYSNFSYLEYKIKTGGYASVLGNANLKPTSMTSWEFGIRHKVADYFVIDVTGFLKNINDVIGIVTQPASPNSFDMYMSSEGYNSKGLEVQVGLPRRRGIAGELRYTVQKADGDVPFTNTHSNIPWTVSSPPRDQGPLPYDQRHKLTAIIDARLGERGGLMLGSIHPFERSGINFVFNAASGFTYTPVKAYNSVSLAAIPPSPAGGLNSSRVPATYRLDLKADKMLPLGGTNISLYLWVLNVFDRVNILEVYPATGSPDDTGFLATADGQAFAEGSRDVTDASLMTGTQKYQIRQKDPSFFDTRRQIRVGIVVAF